MVVRGGPTADVAVTDAASLAATTVLTGVAPSESCDHGRLGIEAGQSYLSIDRCEGDTPTLPALSISIYR
jgi:hypothetical protein